MSSAYRTEERRRQRRRVLVRSGLLTVVTAAVAWVVGADVPHALALATVVPTAGVVLLTMGELPAEPSLPPLDETGRSDGARREVSRLSWMMTGRDHRVGDAPFRRLRALAQHRLSLHGVDLTAPEDADTARRLLGPVGYDALVVHPDRAPTGRVFEQCLTVLERLDGPADHPARDVGPRTRRGWVS